MSVDFLDPRMRCRVQPGRDGETRVIIEMPSEEDYIRCVMIAISVLAMNRFPRVANPDHQTEVAAEAKIVAA